MENLPIPKHSPRPRVLLAQLPVPSSPGLNTPLAAGYLAAYATARGLDQRAEISILPRAIADRAGDQALAEAIIARRPAILGLSLYTWNSERSLAVAARVKRRLPGLTVVVGGPEVQPDNRWVLEHPAVDIAVVGEGEQTFAELLEALCAPAPPGALAQIPGVITRGPGAELIAGPERVALGDLAPLPSPYLSGWLDDTPAAGMLMVEVSRWCPYSCSFCLYGRNMGPRLGSRYFGLERILAEVAWGKARGIRRVHFVEANLNLVPIFWPLIRALADLNADRSMTFYAELRGEHLSDEVVAALAAANVRVVEVGLQTANPAALRASRRRTDLAKWAAGTRRLYQAGIEVLLDVILGLPEDDLAGVAETIGFIEREGLGPYDIFTLQVLPGTAVRHEAARHGLVFQGRPPYYVLGTARLGYAELRGLRRELKLAIGAAPDAVEGLPPPRPDALLPRSAGDLVDWLNLAAAPPPPDTARRLASHVDLLAEIAQLAELGPRLAEWLEASPTTVFDLYLSCGEEPPDPAALAAWRDGLPLRPGYLERVAVFLAADPEPAYRRVSPRIYLLLPWVAQADPERYAGVAEIIWRYQHDGQGPLPLGAWRSAGGAGIALHLAETAPPIALADARAWAAEQGRGLWLACGPHLPR